jgi:hypothetical protein
VQRPDADPGHFRKLPHGVGFGAFLHDRDDTL